MFEKITRVLTKIATFLLAIIIFFFDIIKDLFPWLTIEQLFGAAIALFISLFIMVFADMKAIRLDLNCIEDKTLSESIAFVFKEKRHINKLCVFASTTGKIVPIIAANNPDIDDCYVLIRRITGTNEEEQLFNLRMNSFVNDWKELQKSGKIKKLHVKSYDFFPINYSIIVDNSFVIYGLLNSDSTSQTKVSFANPSIFNNKSLSNVFFIEKMQRWFDSMYDSELVKDYFEDTRQKLSKG